MKSCRGIALGRALIGPRGIALDREWMFVDEHGRFLTQRTHPRLALVETALDTTGPVVLRLRAPGRPELVVSAAATARDGAMLRRVKVWEDAVLAEPVGEAADQWISTYLGVSASLVHAGPQTQRQRQAPISFSDGYPLLVCNQASLDDLNSRMAERLPMDRFRPNLVLADLEPYAEDRLDALTVGPVTLRLVKACTRCAITATDQASGKLRETANPLPVLRGYRFDRGLKGVTFGQNAIVVAGEGHSLELGSEVELRWRV